MILVVLFFSLDEDYVEYLMMLIFVVIFKKFFFVFLVCLYVDEFCGGNNFFD